MSFIYPIHSDPTEVISEQIVSVVFGDLQVSEKSTFHQNATITSSQVTLHENWDPDSNIVINDIALIFMPEPFTITNYVRPICLATLEPEMSYYSNCYATGWGADSDLADGGMSYIYLRWFAYSNPIRAP